MTVVGRRRFLTGLGVATIVGTAGCGDVIGGDQGTPTVPADRLLAALAEAPPAVHRSIPVDVERTFLQASVEDVWAILAPVPTPLTADDVPNGAIRRDVIGRVDRARSYLHAAEEAPTPYEAMRRLVWARGEAVSAAAAWGAIHSGLTRGQVVAHGDDVLAGLEVFADRWDHVGDDPVRATLVHAAIEDAVRSARTDATIERERRQREPVNPVSIGDLAADIGRATASIEQSAYLLDRYTASLAEARDLRPTLQLAAGRLADAVSAERRQLPDVAEPASLVEPDVGGTPAAEALQTLHDDVRAAEDVEHARAESRPARAVLLAQSVLARLDALASLRTRIDDGEAFAVATVDDVDAIRSAATEAVASTHASSPEPMLTDWALASLATRLQNADDRIAGREGSVRVDVLQYPVSAYVVVEAVARALPEASQRVASALRSR